MAINLDIDKNECKETTVALFLLTTIAGFDFFWPKKFWYFPLGFPCASAFRLAPSASHGPAASRGQCRRRRSKRGGWPNRTDDTGTTGTTSISEKSIAGTE